MKIKMPKYEGKDRIVGRPIRLNKRRLRLKYGKDYTEIVFFGDLHYGARECEIDKAKRMLDYCLLHNIYVFLMGDLMEAGLKTSVGASMYRQKLSPQQQMEDVVEFLKPLSDQGLILGSLEGNHELRIEKDTGISVMKLICRITDIPYLGSACWNLWYVGDNSYSIYTLHGSSGSRYVYTKLKALVDISHNFKADLMAMGHVHDLADTALTVQEVDKMKKQVVEYKKHLLITGHYLAYEHSYAQERGYPIGKMGSPKVKLYGSGKKDIHISY